MSGETIDGVRRYDLFCLPQGVLREASSQSVYNHEVKLAYNTLSVNCSWLMIDPQCARWGDWGLGELEPRRKIIGATHCLHVGWSTFPMR